MDFAGFIIIHAGVKLMNQMLNTVKDFPTLINKTGARSCFRLANQVAYAFSMVDEMLSFRDLLKCGAICYRD